MKILALGGLLILLAFGSCKKEKNMPEEHTAKTKVYKLTSVSNPWTNMDKAPDYVETITFYPDSTFLKTRINGPEKLSVGGTYTITSLETEKFYKLSFNTESSLTIYGGWLNIKTPQSLVYDITFVDGPRLIYTLQ
ncbi:hypothetical protein [Niabella hibiscisoli]|uniref:hypothetical protein n=1 Tax=Niabella hibiscisoli TaxID=1825928 RepID=UPI001F0E9155|nr:hypothetical protein [Niabella hibiscisoli]MCH5715668.1 hypothetical protein [Niabella hibiscisoli]